MNIEEIFRCFTCNNILHDPVTLPCGDSVCKIHIDECIKESDRCEGNAILQFACFKCDRGFPFPPSGFEVNIAMDLLLKRQLEKLDFGQTYKDAIKECERLRSIIQEYKRNKDAPELAISEHFSVLRSQIDILKEDLKERVSELGGRIVDKLSANEAACKDVLRLSQDSFAEFIDAAELRLKGWSEELELIRIDEDKWVDIKMEAVLQQNRIKLFVEKLNNEILASTFCEFNENDVIEGYLGSLTKQL
jgi:hypothetical protein